MRSTQGLQSNQIQCGKVTGAASPSTLAFTKMIKVDLSPTRVHSLAKIFILLLLSLILVKRFFFHLWRHTTYCINGNSCTVEDTPVSMEMPSWRSIKFSKFVKGLLFSAIQYAVLETRAVVWKSLFTLCIQVWQYVNAQSEQTVFQSTARVFRTSFSAISRVLIASLCAW